MKLRKLTLSRHCYPSRSQIQYKHRMVNFYPKCTLAGKWLRDAGFEIGEQVTVRVEEGELIIARIKRSVS